jgi:hypothetical protein
MNEYITLGKAHIRWAEDSKGARFTVLMEYCQTHEDHVKAVRDNMIKAIEAYAQLTGAQQNTTTKE